MWGCIYAAGVRVVQMARRRTTAGRKGREDCQFNISPGCEGASRKGWLRNKLTSWNPVCWIMGVVWGDYLKEESPGE